VRPIDRDKRSLSDALQQSLAADQPEKKVGRGASGDVCPTGYAF